jgi:rubrerythrin
MQQSREPQSKRVNRGDGFPYMDKYGQSMPESTWKCTQCGHLYAAKDGEAAPYCPQCNGGGPWEFVTAS